MDPSTCVVVAAPFSEEANAVLLNQDSFVACGRFNEVKVEIPGNPFYPIPQFAFQGLEPESWYAICICMEKVDGLIYKYDTVTKVWRPSGNPERDLLTSSREVYHHHNFQTGRFWMEGGAWFTMLRLTSDYGLTGRYYTTVDKRRRYRLKLHIRKFVGENMVVNVRTIRFENTEFFPVTKVTNMEIRARRRQTKY